MNLATTIVLVSSSVDRRTFGTGFLVHQDAEHAYIVTCAHVVRDIETKNIETKNGETGRILAGSVAAEVVARGEPHEIDLAVLKLPRLWNREPLRLQSGGSEGAAFSLVGQCELERQSACIAEQLRGHLAKEIVLSSPQSRVAGWRLQFDADNRVQPGYSGGAVFVNEAVVAVAAIQLDKDGREAIAISVEALREIWQEMPAGLIQAAPEPVTETQRPVRVRGISQLQVPPVWVGRDEIVANLLGKLDLRQLPRVVTVLGQGGTGKSGLVAKLLEAIGVDFNSGRVSPSCNFERVIVLWARGGLSFEEAAQYLWLETVPTEGVTEPAQIVAGIVRGLVASPALVVLDNVEDLLLPATHPRGGQARTEEWARLLNALANRSRPSKILITSQQKPVDLGDVRYGIEPDPTIVETVLLEGLDTEDSVAVLQQRQLTDKPEDLTWVARRVGGNPLLLTQLANLGKGKPNYLRKHPEIVTQNIAKVLAAQLERQNESAQTLLLRMGLVRRTVDLQGLTFLRLYEDAWEADGRIAKATEYQRRLEFEEREQEQTQADLDALLASDLVKEQYDVATCENTYSLHPSVADFARAGLVKEATGTLQRVAAFYESGANERKPETQQAFQRFGEALQVALQLGDEREATELAMTMMRAMVQAGQSDAIAQQLQSHPSTVEQGNEVKSLLSIAQVNYQLGNWNESEKLTRQALDMAVTKRDFEEIAMALGQLGSIERNRGNWNEAERLYRQSLELRTELGDRAGMATSWGQLGDIERNRGNWDEAERLYRQSLELRTELGDRAGMATSWGLLGYIEYVRGNWEEAERLYRQSLELRTELGDRAGMATSWGQLGYIENVRGNWNEAERLFRQSLELRTELGDRAGMATSWGQLGDIENVRGNWEEAERLYRQSLELRTELGDREGMATSIGCLGENELGRGNLDKAEPLLRDALAQLEALGMTWKIAEANFDLAKLERKRHNRDRAQHHYNIARDLYRQLGAAKDLERIDREWNQATEDNT